ncbi:MAG TPA: HAD-IA family hydrolase [Burkholderiales bacterium]
MLSQAKAETASKPKRFELLVFDWDGTLTDSADLIVASMQVACIDIGLPVPDADQVRHIIGLGFKEALEHLLPMLPVSEYPRFVERYRYHFLSRDAPIPVFPGTIETIQQLHNTGFLLAVATGKSRKGLNRDFQETGLRQYFHASRCADECFSKPHPGMLLELIEELHVAADKTLMIGDTIHDLQMAQSAGVASLAVSYGAHSKEKLLALSPLDCVNDTQELQQWLKSHA